MHVARKVKATVQPGGKIEVSAPDLPCGRTVDVLIEWSEPAESERPSALDVFAQAPGRRLFKTAEEVDAYIRTERDTWDR
jgi:hypothetical protein